MSGIRQTKKITQKKLAKRMRADRDTKTNESIKRTNYFLKNSDKIVLHHYNSFLARVLYYSAL